MPSSHFNELSDVDKDKSKGGDVVDEVSLVEENNTHRTYQKIKDALK